MIMTMMTSRLLNKFKCKSTRYSSSSVSRSISDVRLSNLVKRRQYVSWLGRVASVLEPDMQSERHANSLPARTIRDMTLLLALSLDCRLFIQRSSIGEYAHDYVCSGASVLCVRVNMVTYLLKCH
jgi:hypothetical protein